MKTGVVLVSFILGLGLALALVWIVEGGSAVVAAAPAAELHVCPIGCTYASVQDAVDAAEDGDVIKVATGTYTDVSLRPRNDITTTGVVTQVVYVSKTVTIQGGYTTANWATSDPVANPTTLDVQKQGRALYVTGDISPTIEGLCLVNGDAVGQGGGRGWDDDAGGGVYVINAEVTIRGCQIASNTARVGGGVYLRTSDAMLSGNTISHNSATGAGSGNVHGGGGLYLYESDGATLRGNVIFTNTTVAHGGGLNVHISEDVVLSGNTIVDNRSNWGGGGVYLRYGSATLSGNTVSDNKSGDGGGVFLHYCDATLRGNAISGNTAYRDGGGVFLAGSSDTVLDGNVIRGNRADSGGVDDSHGGGVYLRFGDTAFDNNVIADNWVFAEGAGVYVYGCSPRFRHNTLARNSGGDGSGLYVTDSAVFPTHVAMTNTILVSHTVGITVVEGTTVTLEATLWYSNTSGNAGGAGAVATGTVDIYQDPAFAADGYHLTLASPARDRGVIAGVIVDVDGDPRGTNPEIGADEYAWYIYVPVVLREYQ